MKSLLTFNRANQTVREILRCVRFAPLAVLALIVYAALPSTAIFGEEEGSLQEMWHPSYLNWGDAILVAAMTFSWVAGRLRLDRRSMVFLIVVAVSIVTSLTLGSADFELLPGRDGIMYWLRFALVFSLAGSFVIELGTIAAESLLIALFLILCATAVAVYTLSFGTFNRIYASAMTVASFSQVAVVVGFIAMVRRNYFVLGISLAFLFLTFSRTSSILFLLLSATFACAARGIRPRERIAILSVCTMFVLIGLYLTHALVDYEMGYDLDPQSAGNLHGRTDIWSYAMNLFRDGSVGMFGVGFNRSPLLLDGVTLNSLDGTIDSNSSDNIASFHSILLEYAIGLGIFSLVIIFPLLRRIWQTWQSRCQPSAMIFTFFFLSQSLDFTFYRPKEIILWSFILGMAEGVWRRQSTQQKGEPLVPSRRKMAGDDSLVGDNGLVVHQR